jgi:hypothetical protein
MAEFKLSIDTEDPEIFLKGLVLAAQSLDMTGKWTQAAITVPYLGNKLFNAIDLLTQCVNDYAEYKRETKEND